MRNDYTKAFIETLQAGMSVDEALSGLRRVLLKRNHTKLLASILSEALRILETEKGTKQAIVAIPSKEALEEQRAQISAVLKDLGVSKDVDLKEVVDETLIGGFVATYDYREYDRSYKKALKSLYESITK